MLERNLLELLYRKFPGSHCSITGAYHKFTTGKFEEEWTLFINKSEGSRLLKMFLSFDDLEFYVLSLTRPINIPEEVYGRN